MGDEHCASFVTQVERTARMPSARPACANLADPANYSTGHTGDSDEKSAFPDAMVAIDRPAVVFSEERAMHGMKYKVALRASEEGFAVSVPGLPGCWSQGATEAEALENIKQAIEEYLAVVNGELKDATIREVEVAA
jgi:predicted RNase H-like HicB family nuclease